MENKSNKKSGQVSDKKVTKATGKAGAKASASTKKSTAKTTIKPKVETKKSTTEKKPSPKTEKKATTTKKKPAATKKASATERKGEKVSPKEVRITGFHGLQLYAAVFDNVKTKKAVVVIVHGMQEHCRRYDAFAKFLEKNGYIVIATDLRGHGRTMQSKEEYGFGEQDIFSEALKDQQMVIAYAREQYNLPIYVFGHSYGSMLVQHLVQVSPTIEKAVICGTANGGSFTFKMGNLLVSTMSPFKNKKKRGGLAENLCIKAYGKKFENGNWLSRDNAVFEQYKQDEFCGGSFPFDFYRSLMKNMAHVNNNIGKIGNKKLFLISGSQDPVGENGKQVKKLCQAYLRNNINARMKLYDGARHELLNETNKEEVWQDVLNFFDS